MACADIIPVLRGFFGHADGTDGVYTTGSDTQQILYSQPIRNKAPL